MTRKISHCAILALTFSLFALVSPAQSQPSPPVVRITQVQNLGPSPSNSLLLTIRVDWIAQSRDPIFIVGFDVAVELKFPGGIRQLASTSVDENASGSFLRIRTATLLVPRPANANPISFEASVTARWGTKGGALASKTFLANEIAPGTVANPTPLPCEASLTFPTLEILGVNQPSTCLTGQDCFVVRWQAHVPCNATLGNFRVFALVYYGTQVRTAEKTVSSAARAASLTVTPPAGVALSSVEVDLSAGVTIFTTTELQGNF
ncbi:MAG: hypothetical protein ACRENG_25050 [bacterium]